MKFLLAYISAYRFRKSIFYAAKKLTIIEDLCVNFRSLKMFQYDDNIKLKFSSKYIRSGDLIVSETVPQIVIWPCECSNISEQKVQYFLIVQL